MAEFLAPPGTARSAAAEPTVLAATGHGVYVSRDGGAVWEPLGTGLPFNSKIAGLLTHSASPGTVFAVSDNASVRSAVQPPLILRSLDGGQHWASAAAGLPAATVTAWTIDPTDPNVTPCRIIGAGFSQQRRRSELAGSAPGVQPPQSDRGRGL